MKKSFLFFSLIATMNSFAALEQFAKSVLESICDYDSRTYLALAREKEAKRRARFEAVRYRIMEEDFQAAIMGSKFGWQFAKMGLQILNSCFNFKDNSLMANVGFLFFVGWSSYRLYQLAKKYTPSNKETQQTAVATKYRHYLIDNCQNKQWGYTYLHKFLRKKRNQAGAISHVDRSLFGNS